jgi:hypothetical protein
MSCDCQTTPCECAEFTPCEGAVRTTRCDRYVAGSQNVWVERGDSPNDVTAPGVCMLDTMTDHQIIYSLERDDKARADLLTVTSDPHLIELANTVPRLPTPEESDVEQALLNQPHNSGSIPLYSVFRGIPPFAQ